MSFAQSFAALSLTAALAGNAPAPADAPAAAPPAADPPPAATTTATEPATPSPDAQAPAPADATSPPVSQEGTAEPSEPTAEPTSEPSATVTAVPPPPQPTPSTEPPLQRVDAEAQERMRRGQRLMNISGIVMGSGAGLLVVGIIATLAAGRAPNADDYENIQEFRDDQESYQRRAFPGGIITFVGTLGVLGGAITFAVGGGKYRRGKRASRRVALTPSGTLKF